MQSMSVPAGTTPGAAARAFAKRIHDDWAVGSAACNNGVVLLLAMEERQVYISTGKGAKSALPNDHVQAIIEAAKPTLRKGLTGEAVYRMAVDIGLGLAGGPAPAPDSEGVDWLGVGIFGAFAAFLGHGMWRRRQRRRGYRDCKRMLDKIKREQDRLRTQEWSRPESCPICLEDFAPAEGASAEAGAAAPSAPPAPADPEGAAPEEGGLRQRARAATGTEGEEANSAAAKRKPVTLRCGHTFCEPCAYKIWGSVDAFGDLVRVPLNNG